MWFLRQLPDILYLLIDSYVFMVADHLTMIYLKTWKIHALAIKVSHMCIIYLNCTELPHENFNSTQMLILWLRFVSRECSKPSPSRAGTANLILDQYLLNSIIITLGYFTQRQSPGPLPKLMEFGRALESAVFTNYLRWFW